MMPLKDEPCVRIAVLAGPPMVVVENEAPPYKISGLAVEIFEILMKYIGRCYEWVVPEDHLYGHQLPNGSWTGIIGYIVDGKADIGLPLSITSERLRVLQFTEVVTMEEFVVIYKRPDLQSDITGFIKPFAPMVWLTVFLAAMVVCAVTWGILKAQTKLTRPQWVYTSDVLTIGGLWLLVAFILGVVYRGNLKAMLILPKVELPFNSLKELAASDVKVWSPGSHIAFQMIMAAPPDTTYGMIAKKSFTHMRIGEGIRDVYEGKHAIICLSLAALDSMDKTFSRVRATVSVLITRMKEFGILDYIIQKKLSNGTLCMKPPSQTVTNGVLRALDIVDFFGVFAIYALVSLWMTLPINLPLWETILDRGNPWDELEMARGTAWRLALRDSRAWQ
ncbi:glutamate receptor ionotropic, delta-2-like [Penaeus chinensis]|uniref:glutamate receptor ionotropic, delta-2-like n=1 Tax=Penaeus chinensis TaxID=139456 RepID=UPI001FB57EE7|nr:glutamate receptor ionotropic, delta-2-like [Penaeus chinensis]